MWEKQQQFKDQQQNLTTLQEQLDKLNKQNKELTKNLVFSEHSEIMLMIYKLNQYPRETILLKKMDYNKNLNQFEISGESTSIENIGLFKDSLLEHDLVKDIEIISTSYLTESKVYKVEFSLKGTL